MRIAATATTPRAEDQMRRMLSVRLALFDDHRVQEQPEPDEGGEEDQVAQATMPRVNDWKRVETEMRRAISASTGVLRDRKSVTSG